MKPAVLTKCQADFLLMLHRITKTAAQLLTLQGADGKQEVEEVEGEGEEEVEEVKERKERT